MQAHRHRTFKDTDPPGAGDKRTLGNDLDGIEEMLVGSSPPVATLDATTRPTATFGLAVDM
jgi:hypothetical protein